MKVSEREETVKERVREVESVKNTLMQSQRKMQEDQDSSCKEKEALQSELEKTKQAVA